MAQKIDLCVVSKEKKVIDRCAKVCSAFGYEYKSYNNVLDFVSSPSECRMILLDCSETTEGEGLDDTLRSILSCLPDTFVLGMVSEKGGKKVASLAKKAGCGLVLLDEEFYTTSKPEYTFSQVIRATFIAIKPSDIILGIPLEFDLYHLLPQRNKFLKFAFEGGEISQAKMEKLNQAGEIYIHKDHAEKFAKYITNHTDKSANSLAKRCRSQFLALYAVYTSLVFLMTDQSEHGSFKAGDELLKKCSELNASLLVTLGTQQSAWDVINRSVIGDFGSVERSPAVAAYAALFALLMDVSQIDRLMMAALFSEIGVLFLPPEITEHLRNNTASQMTPEQKLLYQNYPAKSLSVILDRKLQIDEKLRDVIIRAHERADGKGIPGKHREDSIPVESFLIQFAHEVDQKTLIRMGKVTVTPEEVCRTIIQQEKVTPGRFTAPFTEKLEKTFS